MIQIFGIHLQEYEGFILLTWHYQLNEQPQPQVEWRVFDTMTAALQWAVDNLPTC